MEIPARVIARMSWWILLIGRFSGPTSLLLVFVMIPNSHLNTDRWRDGALDFVFAAVITIIAAAVYFALIRHRLAMQNGTQ
jgi:hypothetical protein